MSKKFEFARYDVLMGGFEDGVDCVPNSEGQYVIAQDALDREAVNADRIRLLELQLKEAKARVDGSNLLLTAASHALRSYQFGNSATDLAKDLADKIDARPV